MSARLFIVHNNYQQKGGEDIMFEPEAELPVVQTLHNFRLLCVGKICEDCVGKQGVLSRVSRLECCACGELQWAEANPEQMERNGARAIRI
jgi:hypothetical protein